MTRQQIMTNIEKMGYHLPEVAPAVGSYVPAVRCGPMIYVSGQIPLRDGKVQVVGTLGQDVSIEQGQEAARICALNALAAAAQAADGIENILRIVRLCVFVRGTPQFDQHAKVANGASDLLQAIFGDSGRHARAAVGVASLPLAAAVEVELWAQCR